MKKFFAITLSVLAMVLLCSCGDASIQENPSDTLNTTEFTAPNEETTAPTLPCTHLWGQWVEHQKATCQTPGSKERICLNCNITESQTINMTDHVTSDWIIDRVAAVGVDGLEYKKCIYCNHRMVEKKIPAIREDHSHKIAQWVVVKAADCVNNGSKTGICSCGHIMKTQAIPKLGHTVVTDQGQAPTCTANGLTEGKHCSVCNTVLTAQTVIKAKGHTVVIDKAQAVTCTENGLTEGKHCSACNTVLTAQTVIKAKGHTVVVKQAKAATCTENGLTEGKHCSACNTTIVAQTVIKAKGHTMSSETVAATATKEAHKRYFCKSCTYAYEETIDFAALLKFESRNDGTCKVTGLKDKTVTDLVIPKKSPAGDTVTIIGAEAFKDCDNIESLVLPNTVTRIMYDAFYSCSKLKTVEFPQNGTQNLELEYRSFAFCAIEKLDLTKTTIKTIGIHAFYGCKRLKTVKLGAVTTIDNFAFTECSELTSLIHAGSLVTIGERSFEGCKKLTELRAKNSQHNLDTVEQFSYWSFYGSGIRDIVFSSKLKAANDAFEGCRNLGTVDFSQVSGKFASFAGSKIEKIIFPSSLSRIPNNCFAGATLGNVVLPNSVTEIGGEAFYGATISKITFGSRLACIRGRAFKNAKASYDFSKVQAKLTIEYEAFANNSFTSVTFPQSTVFIGEGALMGCNKLQTLSIPFIGKDANSTNVSTDCFAWLFGKGVDCWKQSSVVPASLKTVILHGENPGTRDFLGVKINAIVIGKDITAIANDNFGSDSTLTRVYYEGTQQQWNAVKRGTSNNQKLSAAEVFFYSKTEPAAEGNFWHYSGSGAIKVW